MSVGQEGFPGGILVQQHIQTGGGPPSAVAGAQNGTTPPAPTLLAGSNDIHGVVAFGSGATPAAGAQVVVTFSTPYTGSGLVTVVVTAITGTGAGNMQPGVTNVTANGFTLSSVNVPAASQPANTFQVAYHVIG